MNSCQKLIGAVSGMLFLLSTAIPTVADTNSASYHGTLRIYVIEPVSRWSDQQGAPFENGFLDFALVTSIDRVDTTAWQQTVTWDAASAGFASVSRSNIMVIAALFNDNGEMRNAVPGQDYPFMAYPVDAAAAASEGVPGQNQVDGGYTHTVFLEEGTLTT